MGCAALALVSTVLLVAALARPVHTPLVESGGGNSSSSSGNSSGGAYFFVLGDWGRAGHYNQSEVAQLMSLVARKNGTPQFVVSTGDNMYPSGLNSSTDPLFIKNFASVYTEPELQVKWHAVLGNHDWGDNSQAGATLHPATQLSADLVRMDWRWHIERSYVLSLQGGQVDLFLVDTSPYIVRYRDQAWAKQPGGLAEQSAEGQLRELEARLAHSSAEWKLLVGHHPPRSNGEHGNNPEIVQAFEPLIQKYGVQVYFAGHDHSLEHLFHSQGPLRYHTIVSGAGSQCDRHFTGKRDSQWQVGRLRLCRMHEFMVYGCKEYPWSGFVAVRISGDQLQADFFTLPGGAVPAYSATIGRSV